MCRLAVAFAVASLLLSGCGSDSGSEVDDKLPADPKTSVASYFTTGDTDALNKYAATAQKAGTKARAVRNIDSCNDLVDYPAWRSCWHKLLDPFVTELTGLAGAFTALTTNELPAPCLTQLEKGAETITAFAATVDALLVGIDSNKRAAQVKSAKTYTKNLDAIAAEFTKPFQAITQVCYSPKDLASINASPSPSP